ncbi:pyridoxamine 5'-phosphate oxidase family protein [Nocardioides sp. LHD-245]|uniref:pyridoxamine 5'-phosphate oxidase family protein n=1 Tax=Nocardioides sp. LHD-245 TaxID=3051387 RepID=UPI0027DFFA4A|nr:pyridoxamine 5'-phosphate oxidase family protein [Nocardioides sp. LHD-245]
MHSRDADGPFPLGDADWLLARRTVRRAVATSLHCSIASTNADGSAHVTPIGSVQLTGPGTGFYFDVFNCRLAENVDRDPRVTIAAVDSGALMWLRSLLRGRFVRPPGVLLVGTVGPARASTAAEQARFHRVLGPLVRTPGGRAMWGTLPRVRDLSVESIRPLRLGPMTGSGPSSR